MNTLHQPPKLGTHWGCNRPFHLAQRSKRKSTRIKKCGKTRVFGSCGHVGSCRGATEGLELRLGFKGKTYMLSRAGDSAVVFGGAYSFAFTPLVISARDAWAGKVDPVLDGVSCRQVSPPYCGMIHNSEHIGREYYPAQFCPLSS